MTKDALEAAEAAARRAADAADKAVRNATSTASKVAGDMKGLAKDLGKQFDGAQSSLTESANKIAKTAGIDTGDSNTTTVIGAVVAGVLVAGAAYYLYLEYDKKNKGEKKAE